MTVAAEKESKFNVLIQATDGSWFFADRGENLSAVGADAMISELRAQGFVARADFAD